MKQLSKTFFLIAVIAAVSFTLSSFKSNVKRSAATSYTITLVGIEKVGANDTWTWTLTNTNPGNGSNGTLQNVSHWSVPLCPAAEAALISAQYSYDGITWISSSINIERDPSIRLCTKEDVLKFDVGTSGTAPTYYRATFNKVFTIDPYAYSYIKTGGGLQGCNVYTYSGVGCYEIIGGPRND
jgi:hypothetical protein